MEIKLDQVEYTYDKKVKNAIDKVDITLSEGRIIGVVGPNGSGKTTLLEIIAGKRIPTNGLVKIDDIVISKKGISGDIDSTIGLVSQLPDKDFLYDTIEKELGAILENHNYNPSKRKKHICEALTLVGLDDSYLNRDPQSLSSGELRRFSLACILSFNPKIILLDEPFIGLDSKDRNLLLSVLATVKTRYKKIVVIASNNIDWIHKISDDIIVLNRGKIVSFGTRKDAFKNNNIPIPLPNITKFENYVLKEKKVHLENRIEINDLVKDILRNLK